LQCNNETFDQDEAWWQSLHKVRSRKIDMCELPLCTHHVCPFFAKSEAYSILSLGT